MVLVAIMEEIDILKQSLEKAPIIWKGDYPYFIHPITDGVPRLEPNVLEAIIELSVPLINWDNIDVILRHRSDGFASDGAAVDTYQHSNGYSKKASIWT